MLVPSPIRFSIDTIHKNMMLVTIISLLLVIIFMLCLHLYARWYFSLAHQRSQTTFPEPYVLRSRLHRRFPATSSSSSRWGLPLSVIASLPLFIHKSPPSSNSDYIVECAICLSVFLEEEIGRKLPGCGHVFHVDCIDMWLYSHSTCPICRSLILCHYDNHIAEYIEIDLLDQEGELELEIHNPQNSPVKESRKTTNMVLQVDSGPGCSSSSG